jgi:2-phosphoglycolate phosphatase
MTVINTILFDLDGTLLHTAPDLVYALNKLRVERGLTEIPLEVFCDIATHGSKAMIKMAFEIEENHKDFMLLRTKFIEYYEKHLADTTHFFPQMEQVLTELEAKNIPWGIVTNKLTRHTEALLKALSIHHRPACIVCGDTLTTAKPNPAPILHACKLLNSSPQECLFVGDSLVDVTAGKAAGTKTVVALYGYIGSTEDPYHWNADGYINHPGEILDWLTKYHSQL